MAQIETLFRPTPALGDSTGARRTIGQAGQIALFVAYLAAPAYIGYRLAGRRLWGALAAVGLTRLLYSPATRR